MQKILITGAAGFIPSSLVDALLKSNNYYVVGIDNMLTGRREHVAEHKNYKFIKADANSFADMSTIMARYAFDYVFHYAAVVGVKRTLDNPSMVLNDTAGLKNILELSKNTGVERIFFSSSSEVYGEPVEVPQHEEHTALNSRLPYAIVKNLGESYLKSYYQEYGLNYTIFRFFNTYGERQSEDFVIAKFIAAAKRNDDLTIFGDGLQTRTFCYIKDNIDFTLKILKDKTLINEVVNVGHHEQKTLLETANTIKRVLGSESKIVHLPALEDGDMKRRQPDNSKMLSVLGRELTPFEEGLKKLL